VQPNVLGHAKARDAWDAVMDAQFKKLEKGQYVAYSTHFLWKESEAIWILL
jgi:hypothetical protein